MDVICESAAVFCFTPFAAEKIAPVMTLDYLKAEAAKGKRRDFKKWMKMVSDAPSLKGDGR